MWYKKYRQYVLWISHKARLWQTDRQNYDSQDRASIASRGKNKLRFACVGKMRIFIRSNIGILCI